MAATRALHQQRQHCFFSILQQAVRLQLQHLGRVRCNCSWGHSASAALTGAWLVQKALKKCQMDATQPFLSPGAPT